MADQVDRAVDREAVHLLDHPAGEIGRVQPPWQVEGIDRSCLFQLGGNRVPPRRRARQPVDTDEGDGRLLAIGTRRA